MKHTLNVLFVTCLLVGGSPLAGGADRDPAIEARVTRLANELRCLVCQNQSLAESNADLAIDLKNQVREMVKVGKSDVEIRDFMVARYGDFVLYKPPVKATTVLLWAGPFLLLLAAAGGAAVYLRRRHGRIAESRLTPEQHARAEALLHSDRGAR
jgi:cytochrome c-type biogenesis protein CcmH